MHIIYNFDKNTIFDPKILFLEAIILVSVERGWQLCLCHVRSKCLISLYLAME